MTRPFVSLAGPVSLLAIPLMVGAALAEDVPRHLEFGRDAVKVVIDLTGSEAESFTAHVRVTEDGSEVLTQEIEELFSPVYFPEVSFVEMDGSNSGPEILVTHWTGGAHCCTAMSIYSKAGDGWHVVDAGAYDGEPQQPFDADGDGLAEIVTFDNAFFYRFASYAGSYAPRQVLGIRNGELADVTAEPGFASLLRNSLNDMGEIPGNGPERNSWLAAYAATLLLLGEDDPLDYADGAHDPAADWGLEQCSVEMVNGECPEGKQYLGKFPDVLRTFLAENGYMEAAR